MYPSIHKMLMRSILHRGHDTPPRTERDLFLDEFEDRTSPAVYDLLTHPASTPPINDALFTHFIGGTSHGSDKFLSLRVSTPGGIGVEEGYNTDASLDLDTKEPTRALLLSEAPIINIGGVNYREFVLDINETRSDNGELIVMNDLRVYAAPVPTLSGYDPVTRELGGLKPLYDFDTFDSLGNMTVNNSILLSGSGSGGVDMTALIPVSAFGALPPTTTYVYLYSKLGDITGLNLGAEYQADDGLDHWTIAPGPQSPLADLSILKTDNPDPATPGGTLTYTLTVRNNGPTTVDSVLLTDTIPAALSGVTFSAPSGTTYTPTYDPLTRTYSGEWSGFTLASGQSISMQVTATISPTATGIITNSASVYTTGVIGDSNLSNNTDTEDTSLIPAGDLSITKTDGLTSVIAGQSTPVIYTVTISNSGPSTFTSLVVKDIFPVGLTNITVFEKPAGSSYNLVTGDLTGINLPAGGSIVLKFSGYVISSATGTLINTVTVAPPTGAIDTNPNNNEATDTTDIIQQADLSVLKDDPIHQIYPGQAVAYYIMVTNPGPSDAIGVTLTDVFPPEVITHPWFILSTSGGATSNIVSGTDDISVLLNLPAGSSITFQVDRIVDPALDPNVTTQISNTAFIGLPLGFVDPNLLNNSSTHVDDLVPPPMTNSDLSITKSHTPNPAVPGEQVVYTIIVTNAGPDAVTGATVTDTFLDPSVFSALAWTATWSAGSSGLALSGSGAVSDVVTLPSGGTITYTITGTILPTARGDIHNTAVVEAPPNVNDDTQNNVAQDVVPLTPEVDLLLDKDDGELFAVPGTTISYTITVTNRGPSTIYSVNLSDTIPLGLSNIVFTPEGTTNYSPTYDSITRTYSGVWSGFTLATGESITMTVTGLIASSATGTLRNVATVTPIEATERTPLDNTDDDVNDLRPSADVSVVKTNLVSLVVPGLTVNYTIVVRNDGPSDATGVQLSDTFPGVLDNINWTSIAANGATGNTVSGSGNLGDILNLPVGATVTYYISAHIDPTATETLSNTATVTVSQETTDPNLDNNTSTHEDELAPQADLGVVKTSNLSTAIAGSGLVYTITVTNYGPSTISSFELEEELPAGFTVTGRTVSTGDYDPITGQWENLNLATGQSVQLVVSGIVGASVTETLTNVVTVSPPSDVNDFNPSNNTDQLDVPVVRRVDVSVVKTNTVTEVVPGTSVTYTITVRNDGPSNATGVRLSDNFPGVLSGVVWTSTATGGATGNTASGSGNLGDILNLPVGATVTYRITAQVDPSARGSLTNTASVTLPPEIVDTNPGNNVSPHTDQLTPLADLGVVKSSNLSTAIAGQELVYTMTVTNYGPSTITSFRLLEELPIGFQVTGRTTSAGTYNPTTGQWTGLNLATGQSVRLFVSGIVASSATGSVTNVVTVTPPAGVNDLNPSNNTDELEVPVVRRADVSVVKSNTVTEVVPGLSVTYTITVRNDGPSDATGVQLADNFPGVLSNVVWTSTATGGATGNTASGSGNLGDILNLPVGATVTYQITARVDPSARGSLTNTATVTVPSDIVDTNPGNNVSPHTDVLTPKADLGVVKTTSVSTATVGGGLVYTITVTNYGPSTVNSFRLVEEMPTGFQVTARSISAGAYDPATGQWTGLNLAAGQSVQLLITGVVTYSASAVLTNAVTVTPPADVVDELLPNNRVVVDTPVAPLEAGDADRLPVMTRPEVSKSDFLASMMAAWDPLMDHFRAAMADFNGDGIADTVMAPMPGVTNSMWVVCGRTCENIFWDMPFGQEYIGGMYVTTADITGDGVPDMIVTPDEGGGPRVEIYDGATMTRVVDFFGIEDIAFRGGIRTAAGDMNGDGAPELMVAAGYGGGPRVTIWDGMALRNGSYVQISNFFAFEQSLRNGVYIAAGDMNGDGAADLILGGGPGGGPRIRIMDGKLLLNAGTISHVDEIAATAQMADFFAGDPSVRSGVRVAFWDSDEDGHGELITGSGPHAEAFCHSYEPSAVLQNPLDPPLYQDLTGMLDTSLMSAVFVG